MKPHIRRFDSDLKITVGECPFGKKKFARIIQTNQQVKI